MSAATVPEKVSARRAPEHAPVWPRGLVFATALIGAYWVARFVVNTFLAATFTQFTILFASPLVIGLALVQWWLIFSRVSYVDRFWGLLALGLGATLTACLAHPSLSMGFVMYALPAALTTFVAWIWIARGRGAWAMRCGLVAVSLLTWGFYALIRVDGIDGNLQSTISWRWTPSAEDKFLSELPKTVAAAPQEELVATAADWPEFRGRDRDSRVHGVRIDPDWKQHPPQEVWRKRIGPGWSSFCVVGDYLFTQEQRGEQEVVSCYRLATGEPVWTHEDEARFWEVVAGAGPRATPTFHNGKLFAQGASGKLNCLEATTGKPVWARDIAADAQAKLPQWGFSSSPLITHDLAIVFAGGPDNKAVLAYDIANGDLKWSGGQGSHSYSSAQIIHSGEQDQILVASDFGIEAFEPATGKSLWQNEWKIDGMARVVQPSVLNDHEVLVGTGYGHGLRLVKFEEQDGRWNAEEVWTSKELKPYFNDFVCHDGYAYGFDGSIFGCVDTATGVRKWKKGRYGHGQVLLLADQGLLIVVSETGELALLEANPKKLVELGKFQALSGKTWNHPVVVGNKLLVRNDAEMACYELPLEESNKAQK